MDKLYSKLESGEESEAPGLLEQWLREGKVTEEEAIIEAITMFTAGIDTVNIFHYTVIFEGSKFSFISVSIFFRK